MARELRVRYEWDRSRDESIDMKSLGQSLLGIERIVSFGLSAIETGKLPRSRHRVPFSTGITRVRPGSLDFEIVAQVTYSATILVYSVSQGDASSFLMNWIMGAINMAGGRRDRAMESLEKINNSLLTMTTETQREQNRLINRLISILENLRMTNAARGAVSAVDSEDKKIFLDDHENGTAEIDKSLADAVANARTSPSTLENLVLKVDGFSRSSKSLKVVHPEDPNRYLTAYVTDPYFGSASSPYLEAATDGGELYVVARVVRHGDEIVKLYILDATMA